ncbi:MAG: hypothetical protein FWF69_09525 [Firmicutes bacterium]|nr:hypothetical protein [Bacillota bacterium]
MTAFKESLRRRVWFCAAGCAGAVMLAVALFAWVKPPDMDEHLRGFIQGMQAGMLSCAFAFFLLTGIRCRRALMEASRLKRIYIAENDERRRMIRDKIGSVSFLFMMIVLTVATVIFGYYDKTVFFTLLGVTLFVSMTKVGMKLYYQGKY